MTAEIGSPAVVEIDRVDRRHGVDERPCGVRSCLRSEQALGSTRGAHDVAVDEAHDVERLPVDLGVVAQPDERRDGHARLAASPAMMRCSRPMSWALASTWPSGGRRST